MRRVYDNVSIFENLYETQEMRSFALISAWVNSIRRDCLSSCALTWVN